MKVGLINFSPVDIYGYMSVQCENIRCKHCDDKKLCYLFRISITKEGKCGSFEPKNDGDH